MTLCGVRLGQFRRYLYGQAESCLGSCFMRSMRGAVQGWDTLVMGTISQGRFVQGGQHPRTFGRRHIGRGHINPASLDWCKKARAFFCAFLKLQFIEMHDIVCQCPSVWCRCSLLAAVLCPTSTGTASGLPGAWPRSRRPTPPPPPPPSPGTPATPTVQPGPLQRWAIVEYV
jgi:hypothetical protein